MSGRRVLVLVVLLTVTTSLTAGQRWPNFQELFHRLKVYQSNPRVFRARPPPPLPSPAAQMSRQENTVQRRNDSAATGAFSPQMSYSQKKAALKSLLIKSAGTKPSNVAPLALGLLQKLKGRPLQADKHSSKPASHSQTNKMMSKPLQTVKHSDKQTSLIPSNMKTKPVQVDKHPDKPPAKKMYIIKANAPKEKFKKSGQFSPPRSLDSGFTPFFLQSKAFDEKSYLESLTTPMPNSDTTSSKTISVDKATQMFGEKKKKMKNTKQFNNNYYKLPVFRSPPAPATPTTGTVGINDHEMVPFEDEMGFTKHWNFESERQNFYEPEEALAVTRPIEVRTTTVPYVRQIQYSDDWDRTPAQNRRTETDQKYTKRKYDIRVPHRNQFPKADISTPHNTIIPQMPQRKFAEEEFKERNTEGAGDVGFMESLPFSIPEELKLYENDFNNFHWSKEELDPAKIFESTYDSNAMRNIERVDRHEIDGINSRDKIQYYEHEGQEEDINSFGDNFSFTESRMGTFFNDIEDTFPSIVNFGPSWESRKYR